MSNDTKASEPSRSPVLCDQCHGPAGKMLHCGTCEKHRRASRASSDYDTKSARTHIHNNARIRSDLASIADMLDREQHENCHWDVSGASDGECHCWVGPVVATLRVAADAFESIRSIVNSAIDDPKT
ncbi:hypothetical protein LCGC14_1534940 [marine sediment metagenome]|uniref:Uncharacterized protein n=1 Tax=marine sediment metagenome TaxID=412755 RepID=A0A0F9IUT3_9ZZZZ